MSHATLLEDRVARQLAALFEDQISDAKTLTTEEAFDQMCQQMLANYSEMDSAKFRELMRIQLATLGPNAPIDDLVRAMCRDGVVAPPKHWRDDDLVEFDDRQLAVAIGRVIADEIPRATRAAFNSALG